MSSQVPRQELLEAGRKKLKDYQQKRRSMNIPPTPSTSTTSPNKRLSASSLQWRSNKPLAIPSNHSMAIIHSTVTSPTSLNEESYPLPPPSIMNRPSIPPTPVPTTSTPVPSSSASSMTTSNDTSSPRHQRNTRPSRHERSQSINITDYSSQFPSTWAYANSSRIPLNKPTSNMDEALIWIQQNNRLVQENLRLKKELDRIGQEKKQLIQELRRRDEQLLQILQEKDVPPRKALEEER
ncbi:hypothetical protein BDA99DRAFT_519535 [Phascolomyces articulosus]|uniref:Uncharacterized protein n=1 Tax=Phascolomyces articulosus TaxID=60185 RepID=A0AAD5JTX2_9FUNG|nr:hypothetical protein BDA99DRAFT_519535 [Phascolomyces articulosus]